MIFVITGLPRSGTTLAMKMLEAGGIPAYYNKNDPLHRDLREHPNHSKLAKENYDSSWVAECEGMCVKNLMPCFYKLPKDREYRFIWMDRDAGEHANSNRKFVRWLKRIPPEKIEPKHEYIKRHKKFTKKGLNYLGTYDDSQLMRIRFEAILKRPYRSAIRMAEFVGLQGWLDIDAMGAVVIPRHPRCHKGFLELEANV